MIRELITQKKIENASRMPDFTKIKTGVNEKTGRRKKRAAGADPEVPDDVYRKCSYCGKPLLNRDVRENFYRCPKCGGYFRVHARRRVEMIADPGSFEEFDSRMETVNPLGFPGYEEKLRDQREKTGLDEAVICGSCTIGGEKAVLCVMDNRFIMSSMGYNVGEKLTRAIEHSTEEKLPLIIYCCSGGARMQEGIVSLMQMAKTSEALKLHREKGLLYISMLTNPTMGGVTASFAMLGDVILAEPEALIGFAGPRVIEQTIGEKLPEGFQRSEFLLQHGFVDMIVERPEQKAVIARLIRAHDMKAGRRRFARITGAELSESLKASAAFADASADNASIPDENGAESRAEVKAASRTEKSAETGHKAGVSASSKLSAWDKVRLSRSGDRPRATDYIELLFSDFTELHGDRAYGDDSAVVGGVAFFHGLPVTVIAEQKGKNTKDNLKRNFGMPKPEGYRKALRLMKEAEVFGRPVICFVDTPGAYPGISSEERGQGEAIARCIYELSGLKVPVLSIVISEGGSGGALALGVANRVWMMENATYSILSPEGFASILYKDAKKAAEASELMKITAEDLLSLGVIDAVIPEPESYNCESMDEAGAEIDRRMEAFLKEAMAKSGEELRSERYQRFRDF